MTVTDDRFAKMKPYNAGFAHKVPSRDLPPGPRLPALLQSMLLMRFRHQFVPAMHKRYGDVFTIRIVPKATPLVLFTKPEQTKEIFAGDPEVFHAGKGNAILGPIMGEHSLLLLDSSQHRRARKLLMPAFNGAALRRYQSVVTSLAKQEVARWTPGTPFRSLGRMNAVTLEVILQVVFGVTDEHRLARLRPLVNKTVDVSPIVLLGWGYPFLQRFGPWKDTVDNQRALDTVMYAEIAERRAAGDLHERWDVLSQLLTVGDGEDGLSDAELRDQLVTLLLAGHETTATALSWSLYELGRDESQLRRAQRAADEGDDDYLEAVLKEAMRLHPVIPMVLRHLMAPARIGGWDLPQGTNVGPSIIITHSREDNYDQPEAFRPERFLEGHIEANTWIPFGGGVGPGRGAGGSRMVGVAGRRAGRAIAELGPARWVRSGLQQEDVLEAGLAQRGQLRPAQGRQHRRHGVAVAHDQHNARLSAHRIGHCLHVARLGIDDLRRQSQRLGQRRGRVARAAERRRQDGVHVQAGQRLGQRLGALHARGGQRRVAGRLGGAFGMAHEDDEVGQRGGGQGEGACQKTGRRQDGQGLHRDSRRARGAFSPCTASYHAGPMSHAFCSAP